MMGAIPPQARWHLNTLGLALAALALLPTSLVDAQQSAGAMSPPTPTPSPATAGATSLVPSISSSPLASPLDEDPGPSPVTIQPPAGASIAYVDGEVGTSPTIRIVTAEGRPGSFEAPGTLPTWAPDNERIAYTCTPERSSFPGSVCIGDLRSGTSKVVIKVGTRARWSPTGELIAYSRDVWGLGDAWMYQPDPRDTWLLPGGQPEWSPTGRWLLYLTARGQPERPVVHVVRPDGSDVRHLGEGWNATWSPDGRRIAVSWWDGSQSLVTAIDIGTGARQALFETDTPIVALRWLPDDGLAFVAERDASSTGDLTVIELATGVTRVLTTDLAVTPDLTVSPDGQWLAFTVTADDASDIYVASRQGGWAPVTTSGQATRPVWQH